MPRSLHRKRREQFEREASELLKRLGAVPDLSSDPWPRFTLSTRAGKLSLSIHTGLWFFESGLAPCDASPWIATRFEDPDAARALGVSLTRFSAKWNFLCWRDWPSSFAPGLALLESSLKRIAEVVCA